MLIESSKKIKTCHVTTVDITARYIILNFLKFLVKNNYDVKLVCSMGKHKDFLEKSGLLIHDIKMTRRITPVADIISFVKLFLYFKKEKFDIVHTYTPKAGFLGRVAARLAGVPVVIHTSYGFYIGVNISPRLRRAILFAEKISSYFCDLIFSQNREDIELAKKEKIISSDKIKLLNYGIDLERFNPQRFSEKFIAEKKKELGVADKKVIGIVGRFVKEKGYLDLFEAFKIIKEKISNVALLMVSPQDKEKEDALDISAIKDYRIDKDTVVLGYEKDVVEIEQAYAVMDVFVLPSYREGFPYSIMEASSMAKPVVATNIRGCKEAVVDGVTGELVELGNYNNLATKIIDILNDPLKAKRMGENGRAKALKDFDEKVVFNKIVTEYDRFIKLKKRRLLQND